MPTVNMTDKFVAGVQATTRANYFDSKVQGLTLRVAPTGLKTWLFVYRMPGKSSQWLSLGSYPALPLVDARKAALDQRRAVDVDGRDPVADRKAERAAQSVPPAPPPTVFTFDDLAKLYLVFAKAKKKTWLGDEQKINRYLRPAWGDRPLRDIRREDIHDLLDRLVANGMTVGVNRIQMLISRMFTIALDRGKVDAHPAARMLKRADEHARERTLTDDELRTLWTGLDASPGPAADATRLRLLLGQRGEETCGMRWDEIDVDAALWTLPATRAKNGRTHRIPLPATALQIVRDRRVGLAGDEPRVFPKLSLASDAYRALATIHHGTYEFKDLRRTFATRLAKLGFSDTVIGRTLNHTQHTVTAKHYNQHAYDAEKRQALEAWDRELARILSQQPQTGATVLPMRHR
jgi:integrase